LACASSLALAFGANSSGEQNSAVSGSAIFLTDDLLQFDHPQI
jgi:hypothetical protein